MIVAIITQHLRVGGIQRLVVDEANEFVKRGDDVFLITFQSEPEDDSLRSELTLSSDHQIHIPYPRMRSLAGRRALIKELARIRPDLVITHHWFANTVGRIAARRASITNVLSFEHTIDDGRKSQLQFLIDRVLQNRSRKVIAVSEPVKASLLRHGIRASNIAVVPNGVDLARFTSAASGTGNRFGFVGRLVYDKGADIALAALAQSTDVTLTIVGDGPEHERLVKQAKDLGIENRVVFAGSRRNDAGVFHSFDCLMLPSRREGFGLVAVEAFASGVPVIASSTAAEAGVVQNGVNGLVVPTGKSEALASAMRRFIDDAALRTRLREGTHTGLERYAIATHVDTLLSLI